jgi:hypothetical protein
MLLIPSSLQVDVLPVLRAAPTPQGCIESIPKRRSGIDRPGFRGTKIKNPGYWRRDSETAQMRRSRERRALVSSA